jgi:hypothetical protein
MLVLQPPTTIILQGSSGRRQVPLTTRYTVPYPTNVCDGYHFAAMSISRVREKIVKNFDNPNPKNH